MTVRALAPWLVLLVVATLLRFYRIDQQIWHDEISALGSSFQRPLPMIATEWPGHASHVLFELLARLSIDLLGVSPLAMRLPAALFGIAGVGAFYWLATSLFRPVHAVVVSAIFAVSYHHVWFSQNARGYTAMIFFFVLLSALLIRFWNTGEITRRGGLAYALTGALLAYSHPVGLSIVPTHVGIVILARWVGRRREPRVGFFPLGSFLRYAVLGGVVSLLLYLPFVASIVAYTSDLAETPGSGPRMGLGLLQSVVEGLSAAFLGPVGLLVAVAVAFAGLYAWLKRSPFALAVLAVPVAVQLGGFVALGIGINPRYLAIALPVVLLIGGWGLITTVGALIERLPVGPLWRGRSELAVLVAAVLVSAVPLLRYYQIPKQDYLGGIRTVNELAAESDLKIGVHLAGNAINGYYHADGFTQVTTLADLLEAETGGGRIWLVTTLERLLHVHDPALYEHIKGDYRLVTLLPGSLGDGAVRVYARDSSVAVPRPHAGR